MAATEFVGCCLWSSDYPEDQNPSGKGTEQTQLHLTLSGLKLANIEGVPWDAIVELRKDETAMSELREFRLFMTEAAVGKDPNQLTDIILSKLDKHEAAARKAGLDVKKRSFTAITDLSTIASSALAALAGSTLGPLPAIAAGAIVPLGKCFLEVKTAKAEALAVTSASEVRYISRLQKL